MQSSIKITYLCTEENNEPLTSLIKNEKKSPHPLPQTLNNFFYPCTLYNTVLYINKFYLLQMKSLINLISLSLLIIAVFFSGYHSLFAQSASLATLKGKVILASGEPASWTEITAQDTHYGTVADSTGNYSLKLKEGKYVLHYSSIGYEPKKDTVEIKGTATLNLPVIILEEDGNLLDAVIVHAKPQMRVKRENGRLAVNLVNTDFEDTRNAWEGLKKTPLLDTKDEGGIQVFGQNALIKINGIETQLSGESLESYLKSLSPKTIEKVEIEPNPGPEYGPEVKAIVNIILKKGVDNYQIGLRTTHGSRANYFGKSGGNYALNKEKFRLYTNYDFSYEPRRRDGKVAQQLGEEPLVELETHSKTTPREHHATINLDFDLSAKDNITLSNLLNFSDTQSEGVTTGEGLERTLHTKKRENRLQFTQVWKHSFNDTVSLKVGAYEVFQHAEGENFAANAGATPQTQNVKTNIPIYIGFADYSHKNSWGTTSAGLKVRDITVKNENHNFGELDFSAPYTYSEKVYAAYLGHLLSFQNGATLQLGLRSETSVIDYRFDSPANDESFTGHPRYTDLLFNADYNWASKNNRVFNISFRKSIERPNYSYLNPFQEISSDVIYSSGDTRLNRSREYSLSFYTFKNNWTFSLAGIYIDDYIFQFFDEKEDAINLTYRNLSDVYVLMAQAQYNKSFFNNIWQTKTSLTAQQLDLNDSHYEITGKMTPNIWFSTFHTVELSPNLKLNAEFMISPPFKQGIVDIRNTWSSTNLSVTQKIGDNLSLNIYANDIFKTAHQDMRTTVSGYYYGENAYEDRRTVGVSLRWSLTGSSYKDHQIQQAEDSSINRLNEQ